MLGIRARQSSTGGFKQRLDMGIHLDPFGRVRRRIQFSLERFLLGGPHFRLLFMVALVGLISVVGGSIIHWYDPSLQSAEEKQTWSYWVWWAFLRLTDPGYLGDDEGALKRAVSTAITICGYVIFMGALIAIMTQWLHGTIRRLEQGLTPIALKNHIVVLGWNERTPEILFELLGSEGRAKRFLRKLRLRHMQIAVLAPDVDLDLVAQLRERLGRRYRASRIILRSGSPLQIDHLRRVDYARAAVLILPGSDQQVGASADHDARTIKCMLTVRYYGKIDAPQGLPSMVAAVHDKRVMEIARGAYAAGRAQIIATDAMVGRMLAQTILHPGLSYILDELLSETQGSELYIREFPEFAGQSLRSVIHAFSDGIILGTLAPTTDSIPSLNPDINTIIQPGHRLVLMATDYDVHAAPAPRQCPAMTVIPPPPTSGANRTYRILILGWNHTVPALLAELDSHPEQALQVDLMSVVPSATRSRRIEQVGLAQPRMQLRQHTGDYAAPADVMALDLCSYHTIVIVGSDRLDTAEDADARSLLGHHLVSAALAEQEARPQLLVELREPANGDLFNEAATEVLPVGEVLSHVVAQIALRPDLRVVFDQLLGPGGPEIIFRPLSEYQIDNLQITFADLLELAAQYGEIALGIRRAEGPIIGGVELNPPRQKSLALALNDDLIVMTSRSYGSS